MGTYVQTAQTYVRYCKRLRFVSQGLDKIKKSHSMTLATFAETIPKKQYSMKQFVYNVWTWLVMLTVVVACSDSESENLGDILKPATGYEYLFNDGIRMTEGLQQKTVAFKAGTNWKAVLTADADLNGNETWCSLNRKEGSAGDNAITISVEQNRTEAERSATVELMAGEASLMLHILQAAGEADAPIQLKDGYNFSPENPDADQPLTVTYKAGKNSSLYNSTEEMYLYAGVIVAGQWKYQPSAWTDNDAKYKMEKTEENTWSITLAPTLREWFASGTTPIEQIALIVRTADGSKQTTPDYLQTVTDNLYKGFQAAAMVEKPMPTGMLHGINIVDNQTVTLVLYDSDKNGKHKDYAHVVGDFNNWTLANDETSQMYRDEANGCWWITISGLNASEEYRFQYYVGTEDDGAIYLSDAYTEKILDPNNDKYITGYDGDLEYPEGGSGIVSTFRLTPETYAWENDIFSVEDPTQLVIYELHLRDFTPQGNLAGAMERLDYLKKLGINAIELMPVQEFDGNDSWGYNPAHFFALDKAYGSKNQYKAFIDACHGHGIAVFFDVVYNHATGDNPFAKLYWDKEKNCTAEENPWFNVSAPHPYSVYHDLNHENPLVRDFVKRNLKFLLEEYHIDGFRFDLTKGFTQNKSNESTAGNYDASRIAILKDYHSTIAATDNHAVMICEHFCDAREEGELAEEGILMWRNMNNAYCQSGMGWQNDSDFSSMYDKRGSWVGFMESHDEERVGYKQKEWGNYSLKSSLDDRVKWAQANAAFCLTVPGPKMIWQFGELNYDYSINSNYEGTAINDGNRTGRKPSAFSMNYDTDDTRLKLYDTYAKILKLRNSHPDLFKMEASFNWQVSTNHWNKGRTMTLTNGTEALMVVGNFTNVETKIPLTLPAASNNIWYRLDNGQGEVVGDSISVPAGSAIIYTNFQTE